MAKHVVRDIGRTTQKVNSYAFSINSHKFPIKHSDLYSKKILYHLYNIILSENIWVPCMILVIVLLQVSFVSTPRLLTWEP